MPFRSISTAFDTGNDDHLQVTPPAGLADGDILVAWKILDATSDTITWPTGFVALTGTPLTTSVTDGGMLFVAAKRAASESGNYVLDTANGGIGGVAAFSGIDATTMFDVTPQVGTLTTGTASPWTSSLSGVTTLNGGCDLIFIVNDDVNGAVDVTHTTPSGFTSRADLNSTTNAFLNTAFFTAVQSAAGATGVISCTGTAAGQAADRAMVLIALRNASPPVGPTFKSRLGLLGAG